MGEGRPAISTLSAAAVMVAVSVPYAWYGVATVTGGAVADAGGPPELFGITRQQAGVVSTLTGILMLVLTAVALGLAAGVLRRRDGARMGAIAVFGLLALLTLAAALPGVFSDPPAPNAVYGAVTGVANAVIVVLLSVGTTADDFGDAEHRRRRTAERGTGIRRR